MKKSTLYTYIVISVLIWIATMFLTAFVVTQLWGWFISPLGVRVINIWAAFGIVLTIRVIAGIKQPKEPDDDKESVSSIFTSQIATAIGVLLVWGVGALFALGV